MLPKDANSHKVSVKAFLGNRFVKNQQNIYEEFQICLFN